ncbi:two-component system histidine kinase [Amycolatopsis mediterranei S699]|uniref:Oxygen sensor histidine kinase NreB n=2 Tax=Amycolatopsis mediterranei TaxID=33910 RepID=A0A0H3DIX4_AMYMU|nr:sensor histidine kinase [Amycolatopsis mediterranei]ADJ50152.1 two-component system histidine kinase [Amycolatopsis mediterranei U32]AEK47149.1 two-component system histidine kinase [Amycolatopsis mediterranei S699]AFO81860.1 two-component system histidine kinase [Amycolatopsis mediterranei S699]AGT88989.1 two-component system histidine kinase [Amycolatopsis mediterranei RB]KDO07599.1 histidine kinase [Amycolatopsis mediterranei]
MKDAWDRFNWLWEILFAVAYLATTVLVLLDERDPVRTAAAVGALTALALTYLLWGRRIVRDDGHLRRRWTLALVVVALVAAAMLATTTTSFILFMVCPLLFTTLDFRPAAVLNTAVILMSPASSIVNNGLRGPTLHILLPMTAILVVFGVLSGKFILHVVEESRGRADLITRLEESQAEVARLSREAGTAAERERLAREIHDTLAQGFTSIVTLAQAIESELDSDPAAARRHAELATRTARDNLTEARAMVAALAPADLAAGSLVDAVRRQADRLAEETGVPVEYEVDDALPPIGMAGEVVLLRGAQEALNNVRRHAAASAVSVRLSAVDGSVRLSVRDDGAGFDPDHATGFGLRGMRSRAEQVGGRLSVRSSPSGTELTLEVPA